jgi:hypothetical protein
MQTENYRLNETQIKATTDLRLTIPPKDDKNITVKLTD